MRSTRRLRCQTPVTTAGVVCPMPASLVMAVATAAAVGSASGSISCVYCTHSRRCSGLQSEPVGPNVPAKGVRRSSMKCQPWIFAAGSISVRRHVGQHMLRRPVVYHEPDWRHVRQKLCRSQVDESDYYVLVAPQNVVGNTIMTSLGEHVCPPPAPRPPTPPLSPLPKRICEHAIAHPTCWPGQSAPSPPRALRPAP